jgi:hypothetical protein
VGVGVVREGWHVVVVCKALPVLRCGIQLCPGQDGASPLVDPFWQSTALQVAKKSRVYKASSSICQPWAPGAIAPQGHTAVSAGCKTWVGL